jgi:hypothetical protein
MLLPNPEQLRGALAWQDITFQLGFAHEAHFIAPAVRGGIRSTHRRNGAQVQVTDVSKLKIQPTLSAQSRKS